ncbi:MAG: TGS domain-containing protein, partial [Clostridia bacterium]|nr:TGS domain-containing protein [Clostridia bacterium]
MLNLVLKDGSNLEVEEGISVFEAAEKISAGLARNALAAHLDGELVEMNSKLEKGGKIEFLTFDDEDGRKVYRHTASHVLAQAVKRLYPEAKLAIGPAIDSGFYYDIDTEVPFTPEVLVKLEDEMRKIIKEDYKLERKVMPREEAVKYMEEKGEPYKVELINDLPEDSIVSFYTQGEFTDLCAGPHLPSTGKLKAIKLMTCTGAYWRGSEKNKMLSRVYGTAFPKQSELDAYLLQIEEAKKRDHRKLGKELGIFALFEEGPGF